MSLFDQDDAPDVMDEISLHAEGRLGTVLRWNPKTRQRSLDQLVWELLPHDTKNPANEVRPIMARAETVAEDPLFASAFRDRRAIVPMSVYYQRRTIGGAGQRFAISRTDGQPMAVAGLWESFRRPDGGIDRTYCIITTEANALITPLHDRMLIVLEKEDWPVWLGEQPGDPSRLLRPPEPETLQCKPTGDRQPSPWRRRL
jgi:putative SOS response-associated peptidase YedK